MDKLKTLESTISQIERNFGKGSVMKLGEREVVEIDAISSGSLSLDVALGIGGLPKGRIVEIYGPESSGKTTLALMLLRKLKKKVGHVHLSMLNTHWIQYTQKNWVLTLMRCLFLSQIMVNKHLKLQIPLLIQMQ